MTWAMQFKSYRFSTGAIKGKDNICADYMSRIGKTPEYNVTFFLKIFLCDFEDKNTVFT